MISTVLLAAMMVTTVTGLAKNWTSHVPVHTGITEVAEKQPFVIA